MENIKMPNHYLLTAMTLGAILLGGTQLEAENPRWVETHSWEGSGQRKTAFFKVNAEKWRLIFRRSSSGKFLTIHCYDENHEKIHTAVNRNAPFFGYRQLTGKGKYYLEIEGEGISWEISVKQLLSRIEEWQLLQYKRSKRNRMTKLASWYGAGKADYSFKVPKGSWRINYRSSGNGKLVFTINRKPEEGFKSRTFSVSGNKLEKAWINYSGAFDLKIEEAISPWHISLDYYKPAE